MSSAQKGTLVKFLNILLITFFAPFKKLWLQTRNLSKLKCQFPLNLLERELEI